MLDFDYNLCPDYNEQVFEGACKKIEERYPDIIKKEIVVDEDFSCFQTYLLNKKQIRVNNDWLIGAVYVESDVDLSELFGKKSL